MIKGNINKEKKEIIVPEVNYRQLQALNHSAIKTFSSNPVQFYEEFVLGRRRKSKQSKALNIGDLVDFYLLDCSGDEQEFTQRFDEKFCLFEGTKTTAQAFTLADYIYEATEKEPDRTYISRFTEAFNRVQAQGKYAGKTISWAIDNFEESPASEYLRKRLDSIDKTTIDEFQLNKAKSIVEQLLTDEFTASIYRPSENIEIYTKFPIEWKWECQYGEVDCKSEIDIMTINHNDKTIKIGDNKCTWDNEEFEFSYIEHGYYIQNAFYSNAVRWWARNNGLGNYVIDKGLEFIVADTSAVNRRPLIYRTTREHIREGMYGFKYRGYNYKGIIELIDEIAWAEKTGIWNIGKEAYENSGRLNLKLFNE